MMRHTLVHFLLLDFCPFAAAAELESSLFGHAGHYHGQQHAHHQEDQTDAEVGSCGTADRHGGVTHDWSCPRGRWCACECEAD